MVRLPQRSTQLFVLVMVALVLTLNAGRTASAQGSSAVFWDQFDVTLELQPDGAYLITERQSVHFVGGPYRTGFADIPLTNIENIGNLRVGEEVGGTFVPFTYVPSSDYRSEAGTFTYVVTSTELNIDYAFETAMAERRTFVIQYVVVGALAVYPEEPPQEQIRWTAIAGETTEVAPVLAASFTIILPEPVPLDQVLVGGGVDGDPADFSDDGQTFVFTAEDMDAGDELDVWLQFPAILDVPPPSWQARADAEAAEEEEREKRSALLNLMFLGAGLLMAVAGGLGIYGIWYGRGRDPHEGLVADFLAEPPDDLPPGGAGALLDERVDEQDAVATMLGLAHRGAIKIEEQGQAGFLGFGGSLDYKITLVNPDLATLPLERDLLSALFRDLKPGATTKLSEVKTRFEAHRDELAADIYAELVKRGYFARSPEEIRQRWQRGSTVGVIAVGIVGLGVIVAFIGDAALVVLPVVVALALALALFRLSGAMPQKTRAGAEAAAKWRAFRRYLDDIEKYEGVDEAKHHFDTYLPYAVAFGLERSWVTKFAGVQTPTPDWYEGVPGSFGGEVFDSRGWDTSGRRRRGRTVVTGGGWSGGWGSGRSSGGGGDFDVDLPDLQDVSDRTGRSLQSTSDGLSTMLNVAAAVFGAMASGGGRGGGFLGGGGRSAGGGGRGFG